MTRRLALITSLLCFALPILAPAQDGVSSAAESRTKYLGEMGVLPSSREIAVEEMVNYHRHQIGRPTSDEAVAMDIRWGNNVVSEGRQAVLQVGFSTALQNDRSHLRPINLSIVIDRSGSMADYDKLTRVKQSLVTLVDQLRPTDHLSIVVFDTDAQVLLPSTELTDKEEVKETIRGIEPGGSTNLEGGLMLGYKEAVKHFRQGATNRVILLTDGIANRGVTDPTQIERESASYNDKGIDLSTIGVGMDLNKDLLRDLAKSGRGLYHFVADDEDINKVFVKEMQSLVSPVAEDPNLTIDYDPGLHLEQLYGYNPACSGHKIHIKLDNMNNGLTEVVLMRFRPTGDDDRSRLPVRISLTYYDLERKREVTVGRDTFLTVGEGSHDMLKDDEVGKNYTIAQLAQSIHDMAAACEHQNYREGERLLSASIANADERYPNLDDADIKRTLKIAEDYEQILRRRTGQEDGRDDGRDHPSRHAKEANIIQNGDFSSGNTGFASDLDYHAPGVNCLWNMGYTIAPEFDNPQLHTLIEHSAYGAPDRPSGNEQVFYANAGSTGSLVLWSETVNCAPHTRYSIRFQSISLSMGSEWIPTYEIRVNGECSDPQAAGLGYYGAITMRWDSGDSRIANLSIVRIPMSHISGLIGISNIEMEPISE